MKRVYKLEQEWGDYVDGYFSICANGYAEFMNIDHYSDRPNALEVHVSDKPVKGAFPVVLTSPSRLTDSSVCGEEVYISQSTREVLFGYFYSTKLMRRTDQLKLWVWVYEL